VDTSNWRPWSKKVILAADWLAEISYVEREVSISLLADTIKNAPEYDAGRPVEVDFEKALYEFYNKSFSQSD
jgi:hypothetical protein